MRNLIILFLACTILFSCKDTSPEEQLIEDIEKIEKYLTDKGLIAQKTDSGLHYIITKEGSGGHPSSTSSVTVRYKGYTLDGNVFDETTGTSTVTFELSNLIQGWVEGIPLLKKSGKGTFLLPSALAYGPTGAGSIGPNEVLIFEIELVDF